MADRSWNGERAARTASRGAAALVVLMFSVPVAAEPARPADASSYASADREARLVAELESAQSELGAAAAVRAEVLARKKPGLIPESVVAKFESLVSARDLLYTGGVGIAVLAAAGGAAVSRRRRPAKVRPSRTVAAVPPPPRRPVDVRPAAGAAGVVEHAENVWGSILRLAAAGMPGEEIARKLGASRDDVELVIGLQRRRLEIAGAVGREAHAS